MIVLDYFRSDESPNCPDACVDDATEVTPMPHKQDAAHRKRHRHHGHPPLGCRVAVRGEHAATLAVENEHAKGRGKNGDSKQHPAKRELHVRVPARDQPEPASSLFNYPSPTWAAQAGRSAQDLANRNHTINAAIAARIIARITPPVLFGRIESTRGLPRAHQSRKMMHAAPGKPTR